MTTPDTPESRAAEVLAPLVAEATYCGHCDGSCESCREEAAVMAAALAAAGCLAVEQIAQARATAVVEAFRARAVEAIRTAIADVERGGHWDYVIGMDHAARIVRDLA